VALIILESGKARRQQIRTAVDSWIATNPTAAAEVGRFMREQKKLQYNTKTGAWKNDNGYVKVRIPSDLFWFLRANIDKFAIDDEDIKILFSEFPDLVPANIDKR
jgi:hypothetical protein